MQEWIEAPVFGVPPDGVTCMLRPSVYGLFEDDRGRLAIVRTGEGIFLPGGGVEPGETTQEALQREALEECGFTVRLGTWVRRAVQFSWSPSARAHCEKRSVFMDGAIESTGARLEADHELLWADYESAIGMLSHTSHAWAVAEWRSRLEPR